MTQEYGKLHPSNLDDLFAGEVWRRNYIANQINKEKSLVEKELADFDKCLTTREEKRNVIKSKFPFTVVLYGAYISHDFAVRWCWRNFGPIDGKCDERGSEFPGCPLVVATCYSIVPKQPLNAMTYHRLHSKTEVYYMPPQKHYGNPTYFHEQHFQQSQLSPLKLAKIEIRNCGEEAISI